MSELTHSPLVPTFVQRSKSFPSAGRSEPNIQFSRVAPLSIRRRVGVILDLCRRLLSRQRQGRPYLQAGMATTDVGARSSCGKPRRNPSRRIVLCGVARPSPSVGASACRATPGSVSTRCMPNRSGTLAACWRGEQGGRQSSCAITSRPPAPPGMPGACMRLCAP